MPQGAPACTQRDRGRTVAGRQRNPVIGAILSVGLLLTVNCSAPTDFSEGSIALSTPAAANAGPTVLLASDAFVRSDAVNKNYGIHDTLRLRKVGSTGADRALIEVDRSSIEDVVQGQGVASATLELTIRRNGNNWGPTGRDIAAHRMTQLWTEVGATWNCALDANPANGVPNCPSAAWDMAGGSPPFQLTPSAVARIHNNQSGVVACDVTDDVVGALGSGTQAVAWALKLVNEGQNGTVVFHSKESTSSPRLVLELAVDEVPEHAPDVEPDQVFYQTASWHTQTSPGSSVWIVRPLLNVLFTETASPAEKGAVVDAVAGEVVGGYRLTESDGYYVVRVPDPQTVDSVATLIGALQAMAGVADVMPEFMFDDVTAHRLPADGIGMQRSAWRVLRGDHGVGAWTQPYVQSNLPLAWGCTTGSPSVRVAVVDHGTILPTGAELSPSHVFRVNQTGGYSNDSHGTRVASVVAAAGNNAQGITGVMWQSDLRLYDIVQLTPAGQVVTASSGRPVVTLGSIANRVSRAAQEGAQVINLSFALPYLGVPTPMDSLAARTAGVLMARVLRPYPAGSRPVIMVAAGNHGVSAWWGGFAQVADSLPDHAIVVAGTNRAETSLGVPGFFASNTGPLVTIAAPGENILTVSPSGPAVPAYATSFAAPFVTGAIGLALSFDPRLSPSEALAMVVEASLRTGRLVQGVPLLDVREALVRAAERPGAPLCGSWLWLDEGTLRVQRGATSQAIGSWLLEYGFFNAEHDGGVVSSGGGGASCRKRYEWSTSGWALSAEQGSYQCTTNAMFAAGGWISHDRDSSVSSIYGGGGVEIRVHNGPGREGDGDLIATLPATFPQAVGALASSGGGCVCPGRRLPAKLRASNGDNVPNQPPYEADKYCDVLATRRPVADGDVHER